MKELGHEKAGLILFFVILFILSFIVRVQFPLFSPILLESQLFFQLMLAVTFIAIMRNVVGINTFGVFAPAIVSFALISAGVFWGIVLFLDVFIMVTIVRFFIDSLKIGANFRVAILVIFVALSITLMEIIGELAHLPVLESSLLFPALITAWYADRYVNKIKEIGWSIPNKQLFWTVIVIILSYYLISIDSLVTGFIRNPELWIVLIILNLYLATKVKFRLTEYLRFGGIVSSMGKRTGLDYRRLFSRRGRMKRDVLSMNVRNRDYIEKYNPHHFFPAVEKLNLKKTLLGMNIPTPALHFAVSQKSHLAECRRILSHLDSFVIKPNKAFGGEGIIVVMKKINGKFKTAEGKLLTASYLISHINQILDGQYSFDKDSAILEERISADSFFDGKYVGGLPDIRVIVFNGFPVMAMVRLPTKQSGGKANLHKGAIGVGLRISTGKAVHSYSPRLKKQLSVHPDTGKRIDTFTIPHWKTILQLAVQGQYASHLGYVGVDIAIDKRKGPLILEVNKRPGLDIQNTNRAGLLKRLSLIEKQFPRVDVLSPAQKIDRAMAWDRGGWNE